MTEPSSTDPHAQPAPSSSFADEPTVAMPSVGPGHKPTDYVDGPSSPGLQGVVINYAYSNGNDYRLSFDDSFGVTFQMLNDGSDARGPLPYLCRELRPQQYLVHWKVRAYQVHVAMVIDLQEFTISVAAMMPPGPWEFFDQAVGIEVSRSS